LLTASPPEPACLPSLCLSPLQEAAAASEALQAEAAARRETEARAWELQRRLDEVRRLPLLLAGAVPLQTASLVCIGFICPPSNHAPNCLPMLHYAALPADGGAPGG
jgi:hypothetical protein